jgi:hypothetical protein
MTDISDQLETAMLRVAFARGGKTDVALEPREYSWPDFAARLAQPRTGAKDGSYYIRGGDLTEPRRHDDALRTAQLVVIDGDASFDPTTGEIAPGAPAFDVAVEAAASIGVAFALHTSYSHAPERPKWRLILPVARLQSPEELSWCVGYVIERLRGAGCLVDDAVENLRWSQPWYLPRVATTEALRTFRAASRVDAPWLDVRACETRYLDRLRAEAREDKLVAVPATTRMAGDAGGVIDAFNKSVGFEWMRQALESQGYRYCWKDRDDRHRFLRPGSETGMPGVVVFRGQRGDWVAYSHHGSACLFSGRLHDAFAVLAKTQHGGDLKAAWRAIAPRDQTAQTAADRLEARLAARPLVAGSPPAETAQAQEPQASTPGPVSGPQDAPAAPAAPEAPEEASALPEAPGGLGNAFRWIEPEQIPARRWIYGRSLLRGHVSVLASAGGVGKTSLYVAEALAIASGRRLLGEDVHERGVVWALNLEDPLDEMQRRIAAAARHHGVTRDEIEGRLLLDAGRDVPLLIASEGRDGVVVHRPVVDAVVAVIRRSNVSVLIVDPFVGSHAVSENDNGAMHHVVAAWRSIADQTSVSVEIVHHFRKIQGNEDASADSIRGGTALIGAARVARILQPMAEQDAIRLGVPVAERGRYARIDDAKTNLSPARSASWIRLASVELGNGTGLRGGDSVGVVERWEPPSTWDVVRDDHRTRALAEIGKAERQGDPLRVSDQSSRWIGHVLRDALPDLSANVEAARWRGMVRDMTTAWVSAGLIERVEVASGTRGRTSPAWCLAGAK